MNGLDVTDRPKVLVLTNRINTLHLLRELFGSTYVIDDESQLREASGPYHLIIADPAGMQRYSQHVQAQPGEQNSIKRPTLGLLPATAVPEATLELFDDTVRLPTTKVELSRRVANLVRLAEHVDGLESKRVLAEAANEAKSSFLANMSHEIRTPLNSILGFADLMKSANLSVVERKYLAIIQRNGHALARLIDDLLDLSKIEAGKMTIEHVSFPVEKVITEALDVFSQKASDQAITLDRTPDPNMPAKIFSDPAKLRQILVNIIGNALKFTDRGSVTIATRSDPVDATRVKIFLDVTDTGIGLALEQRRRLFRAFAQADSSTSRKYGGTGLGLMLSRRMAQALGGDLKIKESTPGLGSTFEISFIATIDHRADQPAPAATIAPNRVVKAADRVLVVDDSPDNQFLMMHLLSSHGYAVETAGDGIEGVEMAMNRDYAAILMDIQMPRMDGYQAVRELRKRNYARPVIALTAHAMTEERLKTKRAGFCAHLVKPIELAEMLSTLRRVING